MIRTLTSILVGIFVLTGVLAYFIVSSSNTPVVQVAQSTGLKQEMVAGSEDERADHVIGEDEEIIAPEQRLKELDREDVTIIFGGDMMFDRYIRQMSDQKGYDHTLDDLASIFSDADLVVANLEGPVTENDSVSLFSEIGSRDNYIFTFDPRILETLKSAKMMVNIGNNHINNFGAEGISSTKSLVKKAQLNYFGDTGTPDEQRYYIKEINGQKIGFVNYNAFVKNAVENTISDIETVSPNADHVILYTHWGEEYSTYSREHEQQLAHHFIDAGADLIIGSHPHVVQESAVYKGKTIYYSLGNFVFDQYFSTETQKGLLVKVVIPTDAMRDIVFQEIPIAMNTRGQTHLDS